VVNPRQARDFARAMQRLSNMIDPIALRLVPHFQRLKCSRTGPSNTKSCDEKNQQNSDANCDAVDGAHDHIALDDLGILLCILEARDARAHPDNKKETFKIFHPVRLVGQVARFERTCSSRRCAIALA
jgi:hypothetical protein